MRNMIKPQFANNHIYHIYNRGVEKRNIFTNDEDHYRFIHNLFEFNDQDAVLNCAYYFNRQPTLTGLPDLKKERKPRKLLVEILIFTLMPNHFHLLVRQKKENGIVKFMQKIGTGYSNYFNKKYERVGPLFQGRFKAVLVSDDAHFIHLPYYIHSNPLDLNYGSSTSIEVEKFLENYKWSSFPDYIGQDNFPSVTSREFLLEFFGGQERYRKEMIKWIKERNDNIEKIKDITLE